jgi:WD40 repeat protein
VSSLAFSPAARQLASASYDGSIRLWDPAAPTLSAAAIMNYPSEAQAVVFAPDTRTLYASGKANLVALYDPGTGLCQEKRLPGGGSRLALSRDGKSLISAGVDGTIRVIDLESGLVRATLEGHSDTVGTVAFSPDGVRLASGGEDGRVILWGARSMSRLRTLATLPARVTSLRYAPDGTSLAVVRASDAQQGPDTIAILDAETGQERSTLHGHRGGITALAYGPGGAWLASAGADGFIRVWDVRTRDERLAIKHVECRDIAFSPDGRFLASAHDGGDVVLWDAVSGRKLAGLKGHAGAVSSVAFSTDGKVLASAGKDKTVRAWNLDARKLSPRMTLKSDLGCIGPVVGSPDGRTLAVAEVAYDSPGTIALWDVRERRVRATLEGHERGVASLAYSPDGNVLASSSADLTIRLWNAKTGKPLGELATTEVASQLAFSPDGSLLASVTEDKVLTIWDAASRTELGRLGDFRGHIYAMAFSRDGRLLAVGGGDRDGRKDSFGEVKVFDVAGRELIADLTGHGASVLALAFAPDGTTLVSGGVDATVRVWDVIGGTSRLALGGFPDCIRALGVSPDGRTVAVAGRPDGMVTLFDAESGGERARLVGHTRQVLGMTFSSDGGTLATASLDTTVKLWDIPAPRDNPH